ncbi:MAG: hypothetical protein V4497_05480 [Bacteroidota bacterium]
MKKIISLLLLFVSVYSFSQSLDEDKIDEFKKVHIKKTSWETLHSFSKGFVANYRIEKIDSSTAIHLKIMAGNGMKPKVFSIPQNSEIIFKLDNEEMVSLFSMSNEITCTGCGAIGINGSAAQGISTRYILDISSINKLLNNKVVKIRIYSNDGYFEDDIKEKRANELIKSIELVQ